MEILRVENLTKIYGVGEARVEALRQVSFSLLRGEFAAVVGVSGSGKSTLLNCIGGLDEANQGKVFLNGRDLFAMGENERTIFRRQNIGFIFQSFHLIPELDVEQNIIFPLLLDYKKLADEPTGNLDSQSSRDVMDLLCKASCHYQQTVLMITHNMNLTAAADRVFRVSDGELEELGGGEA